MNEQQISDFLATLVNVPTHFAHANGVTIQSLTPERGIGTLTVSPHVYNPGGFVHGGALMTLADSVAGCFVVASTGRSCVTTTSSFEFLRPGTAPTITCTATPKKMGKNLCHVAVELKNAADKLVATGTFSFYLLEQLK